MSLHDLGTVIHDTVFMLIDSVLFYYVLTHSSISNCFARVIRFITGRFFQNAFSGFIVIFISQSKHVSCFMGRYILIDIFHGIILQDYFYSLIFGFFGCVFFS